MNRGGKLSLAKRSLRNIDALYIQVDGGEATPFPYPLAEAFDPERRGASCVEHIESANVSEEVEFTVAESDKVVFEFISLFRCRGVPFV